jgi:AraC-like DNA-binding protein
MPRAANSPSSVRFGLTGFGVFDGQRKIGPCTWPHHDILTIHEGEVRVQIAGAAERLTSGESLMIFPHTPFGGESVAPTSRASVIHVTLRKDAGLPQPLAELASAREGCRKARLSTSTLAHDIPRLVALATKRETPRVLALRSALLVMIASEFTMGTADATLPKALRRLQPVMDRVAADVSQPPTVEELARLCGMSASHFRAAFQAAVGRSPSDYVKSARLATASRLLREMARPIKAVAAAAGYASAKDLYRVFTPHFQMPPAAYRAEHQPVG